MPPKKIVARKVESIFQRKGKGRLTEGPQSSRSTHDTTPQLAIIQPFSNQDQASLGGPNELKYAIVNVARTGLAFLKESSDAFPPLKSLLGGLVFLLGNHQKWKDNRASADRLITRLSDLAKDAGSSVQSLDAAELNRQRILEREFSVLAKDLEYIQNKKQSTRYISTGDESAAIASIIERIHVVITDYQFSLQKDMYVNIAQLASQDDMNLLDKLPRAKNADHLSGNHDLCYPGTRTNILQQLETWIEDPNALRVCWLGGHAGSGKSTIAQSFCHRVFASGKLGASFFCSRDFMDRSDIKLIFPTIAFQLGRQFPAFRQHLVKVLRARPDIGSEAMANQLTELLLNPLIASKVSTTIAIEALDECKDCEPASTILSLLARVIDKLPDVKFFVTGRPEIGIRNGFRIPALRPHTEIFQLHEISAIDEDIALYLGARLPDIVKHRSDFEVSEIWPPADKLAILVQKCERLFIFASTVVKLLSSPPPFDPRDGLGKITNSPGNTFYEGAYGINALYLHVLQQGSSLMALEAYKQLGPILGAVILAFNPLSLKALSELLQVSCNAIKTRLSGLHSLLIIPTSSSDPVRIHHKSFPDFLTDPERCSDGQFHIDPSIHHAQLAVACLNLMKKKLRKNICLLPRYAMNSEMSLDDRRACIGEPLEYACRFWIQHVCACAASGKHLDSLLSALCEFLQEQQILWLEVLSLLDDLRCSIYSFRSFENWLSKIKDPRSSLALEWLEDGFYFIFRFYDCIKESAAHLYHSALPLSPQNSLLRQKHAVDLTSEACVIRGAKHWDSSRVRKVTTGLNMSQYCVFSHQGDLVAVGDTDIIKVFSNATGEQRCALPLITSSKSRYGMFNIFFKFSLDDALILAFKQSEVLLWDVQTGLLMHTFFGHKSYVFAVDFSLDSQLIVSGDEQGDILVWDRRSGKVIHKAQVDGVVTKVFFTSSNNVLVVCTETTLSLLTLSDGNVSTIHRFDFFDSYDFPPHFPTVIMSDNRELLVYRSSYDSMTSNLSVYDVFSRRSLRLSEISPSSDILAIQERFAVLLTKSSLQIADLVDHKPPVTFAPRTLPERHDARSPSISRDRDSIAYICSDGTLALQEISFSPPTTSVPTTPTAIDSVRISLDGTMIVGWSRHRGKHLLVWNMRKNLEFVVALVGIGLESTLLDIAISPNNRYLAGRGTDSIWTTDLSEGPTRRISTIKCQPSSYLLFLAFLDEATLITLSAKFGGQCYIDIWDVSTAAAGRHLASMHIDHSYSSHWARVDVSCKQVIIYTHVELDCKWQLVVRPGPYNPSFEEFFLLASGPAAPPSAAKVKRPARLTEPQNRWALNGDGKRILWLAGGEEGEGILSYPLQGRGSTLVFGGYNGFLTAIEFTGMDAKANDCPMYATGTILGLGTDFIRDLRRRRHGRAM